MRQGKTAPLTLTLTEENNLDAIRLALAFAVLWSHCYPLAEGHELHEPLARLTPAFTVGGFAVCAFFSISGYLIAMSYVRSSSPRRFLQKRLLRIVPGYAVAFALSVLVVTPIAVGSIAAALTPYHLARAVTYGLTFGPWSHSTSFLMNPRPLLVNMSLWTIRYELGCYLMIFALGSIGLLRRPRVVLGVTILAAAVAAFFAAIDIDTRYALPAAVTSLTGTPGEWTRLIAFFLAGTSTYLFSERLRASLGLTGLCVVAGVLSCLSRTSAWLILPFALAYFLFYVAAIPSPARRLKSVVGGDYSYGLYLYAFPIQQLIVLAALKAGYVVSPTILLLLATPPSLIAGIVSWHAIEKRFTGSSSGSKHAVASPSL